MPRAFLSYSSRDKPLAQRIARRLSHRGVDVWIDNARMQAGDALPQRLAEEVGNSSHLLVLLTSAAIDSKWVAQELEVAKRRPAPAITIIPVIAQKGIRAAVLDEWVGIEITDPLVFENQLDLISVRILGSPPSDHRDHDLLRRDLGHIALDSPPLGPLIQPLVKGGRITHAQLGAVNLDESLRHPTETALIALHELADADGRYVLSLVAARFYRSLGVGYEVLRRQIAREGAASSNLSTMFIHLGEKFARSEDLAGALRLFEAGSRPEDNAFTGFVDSNFDALTQDQRAQAVSFVVTPAPDPTGFVIDAAFTLYARLPESEPLRTLWWFWVNEYKFGGRPGCEPGRSSLFYEVMNEAAERKLSQFEAITQHFQRCFKALARSKKLEEIDGSVDLLTAAANSRYVHRRALANELANALFSAEWDGNRSYASLRKPLHLLAGAVADDRDFDDPLDAYAEAYSQLRKGDGARP